MVACLVATSVVIATGYSSDVARYLDGHAVSRSLRFGLIT